VALRQIRQDVRGRGRARRRVFEEVRRDLRQEGSLPGGCLEL